MADIFDRCMRFREEQRIAAQEDLPIVERVIFGVSPTENAGPWIEANGRRMLQFSTNDYLGMSVHPEVRAVAAEYAARYGISAPMGARPLTGTIELHLEFERRIADFKRTEAALSFTMGAGAMIGAIACLARQGDLLIMDQLAHASLVCGGKISGASIKFFRHNDPENLERVLKRSDPARPKLIVVDGVYSMNGDIAPLREICDLKERYGARLFMDDAHGHGVCGDHGRGAAEMLGVEERIDLHAGTFSKAFGTYGGFIAGPKEVVFYVRCLAPTILFTKAAPACVVAATMKSLELVRKANDRRKRVWDNARYLQGLLRERGFEVGDTQTPITPIRLGDHCAVHCADILRRKHGVWVSAVVYPAVRRGNGIIRAIPTALHTHEDVDYLVNSLEAARAEVQAMGKPPVAAAAE
ncbi:MAG TPA: aminotransferase class I/II-fold pyridoxal phosphate-dependent enzyme [Planctomycetota bacterium]|nr:aminotransferase class I/II-fold pyridoxal phosphate-dependent enzyme [Planctomycetota bacterium]HRR79097.1 aminotransferase class I/II-fold pyridoxal phosphate-dependent enzyme [Planctomycetota bacterium]HRT93170.1 aminotransferase class I/II-fold pyridoxal phosphate-dependent enzyme [Planctomycetota bacterium]